MFPTSHGVSTSMKIRRPWPLRRHTSTMHGASATSARAAAPKQSGGKTETNRGPSKSMAARSATLCRQPRPRHSAKLSATSPSFMEAYEQQVATSHRAADCRYVCGGARESERHPTRTLSQNAYGCGAGCGFRGKVVLTGTSAHSTMGAHAASKAAGADAADVPDACTRVEDHLRGRGGQGIWRPPETGRKYAVKSRIETTMRADR